MLCPTGKTADVTEKAPHVVFGCPLVTAMWWTKSDSWAKMADKEGGMDMELAEKLIRLRKENGMSQEELADRLGVSRQAVSRWEQGSTYPDIPNLRKLMKVFGVSADYLVGSSETEKRGQMPEPMERPRPGFDWRANRFLIVAGIWLVSAVCFLVAALNTLNIILVGLVLADVLLACLNVCLHVRENGW